MLWNSQKISRVVIAGFCLAGLVAPSVTVPESESVVPLSDAIPEPDR